MAGDTLITIGELARLTGRRLISEFIDDTFTGLDVDQDFLAMMRGAMPDLPDEPAPEQVDAWVELGELVQDPGFRASLRQAATVQARATAESDRRSTEDHQAMAALLRDRVAAAAAAGIKPESAQARPVTDELAAAYARHAGRADGPSFRTWLLELLTAGTDRRYERYWQLLATINGWPAQADLTPAAEWLITALRSY
jgi:hypothetical protein